MAATKQTKKRQATRKKSSTNKRNKISKKNSKKEAFIYKNNLIGVVTVFLLALCVFQTGAVGIFFANCFRYLVGTSYQVLAIFLAALFLYFAVYGKWINLKTRVYSGFTLFYIGCLFWQSIVTFDKKSVNGQHLSLLSNLIKADMVNKRTTSNVGGGAFGTVLYDFIQPLFGNWGSIFLAMLLIVFGIIILFNLPMQKILGVLFNSLGIFGHKTAQSAQKVSEELQKRTEYVKSELEATRKAERQSGIDKILDNDLFTKKNSKKSLNHNVFSKKEPEIKMPTKKPVVDIENLIDKNTTYDLEMSDWSSSSVNKDETKSIANNQFSTNKEVNEPKKQEISVSENGKNQSFNDDDYHLPTTNLLAKIKATDQSEDYKLIKEKSKVLQQTLKSFNIDVTVEAVALGPTVTQYEIKPAIGTRLSKITGLAQDLALALAATSVRIEAPIPGKSLVGIEVPNANQAMIGFRDVYENSPSEDKSTLSVPIGRGITGEVVTADIGKMPHLLIAGQTGSGKSVAINGIIAGLLMKNKPSDLKMVMVDPKQVELSVYNDIPHLLTPVVSDPRKAARALQKVAKIMDERYKLLATVGVRKISEYNKQIESYNVEHQTAYKKMPYIVVVVDEMADLMIQVKSEVEQPIIRIAQLGRASGIHMILATQRPTVDVITGLIKANVPSRIAFAVASGMDSRTIIDKNGAEQLLGHGDMLFEPSGKPSQRVQGAFISDDDVNNLVEFIKSQAKPDYDESVTEEIETEEQDNEDAKERPTQDSQWTEVLEFIVHEQKASTSLLQRRFSFGYNRAARIIDQLEQKGYIGPNNGSKPREVYISSLDDIEK